MGIQSHSLTSMTPAPISSTLLSDNAALKIDSNSSSSGNDTDSESS